MPDETRELTIHLTEAQYAQVVTALRSGQDFELHGGQWQDGDRSIFFKDILFRLHDFQGKA